MSTMNISLPEATKAFVDEQASQRGHGRVRARPLTRRHQADLDFQSAIDHCLSEGAVAPAFVAALEKAFRHIASHPRSGSSRLAHEPRLPGLSRWPLATFPNLVFYVERQEAIEAGRVLDTHCDIAPWLMSPDTL